MKSPTLLRLVLFALGVCQIAQAAQSYSNVPLARRHRGISRSLPVQPRARKCKPRQNVTKVSTSEEEEEHDKGSNNAQKSNNKGGVVQADSGHCGPSGATAETTKTTGPNGSIDWLNCGIESGGWNPPTLKMNQIVTVSLADAINKDDSPFKACRDFVPIFNKYGAQYDIPPIMLASFAMQESSCRPDTVGGAGEQGLMQITKEKCGGAPGGNCREPDFNIRTGAKYFKDTLDANDGNVLLSAGAYNGWFKGMTLDEAQTMYNGNCRTQRNLDYMHQMFNVWCQNINAYGNKRFGKYFNLDKCD